MNDISISAILFYADYISLKEQSIPVTDTCKYFFVHKQPINCAFIAGYEPFYDEDNPYFQQAVKDLKQLEEYSNEDDTMSFVNDIGMLQAGGMCDGERLLKYIHQYSDRKERKTAMKKYNDYMCSLKYNKTITDENGNPRQIECTKYYAHAERCGKGSKLPTSV